ncbi:hypothetical protein CYY_000163 [Polysphondylium violaceum]|uniref:Uncharacterized protein n=2 Tax=Polysphondylium violaceum TaxID=133409 RepID=A0A8J4V5X8_9MYCE|nr:hypothetical protein CYY_000163 [Polysphondylium violaceum]
MSYYTTESNPSGVVYTTTSYNVNSSHVKGKGKFKFFPRFSRKKAAPVPIVVNEVTNVTSTEYGGVVYPVGYEPKKQIAHQSMSSSSSQNRNNYSYYQTQQNRDFIYQPPTSSRSSHSYGVPVVPETVYYTNDHCDNNNNNHYNNNFNQSYGQNESYQSHHQSDFGQNQCFSNSYDNSSSFSNSSFGGF